MASYTVVLRDQSRIQIDTAALDFSPAEDILIWRDANAPWPYVIPRADWYLYSRSDNFINATAGNGRRANGTKGGRAVKSKRSKSGKAQREAALAGKVQADLEEYQEGKGPGPGEIYGPVLLKGDDRDHYAAGKDGFLYVYEDGVYVGAAKYVKERILDLASGKGWSIRVQGETLEWLFASAPMLDDNPDPNIINVKNGLLRPTAKGWKLTPHDPKLRATIQLPVEYEPQAKCPRFDAFIESSQADPGVRAFLDEWYGYNLVPDNGLEKSLLNVGKGGDGKSVYLYALEQLLGEDNSSARTLQSIVSNRFASADLYGKLANICADLSAEELSSTGVFKELTGSDPIEAEKKNKDSFKFHNVARLSFSANEVPPSPDGSRGFFDRWCVVEWPRKFRDTPDDIKRLKYTIASDPAEMSGVLNRALAGLTRLRQTGQFTDCAALARAREQFRIDADNVAAYVHDIAPGKLHAGKERKETWYADYKAWSKDHGHPYVTAKKFYHRIHGLDGALGVAIRKTKEKGFDLFQVTSVGDKPKRRRRGS